MNIMNIMNIVNRLNTLESDDGAAVRGPCRDDAGGPDADVPRTVYFPSRDAAQSACYGRG